MRRSLAPSKLAQPSAFKTPFAATPVRSTGMSEVAQGGEHRHDPDVATIDCENAQNKRTKLSFASPCAAVKASPSVCQDPQEDGVVAKYFQVVWYVAYMLSFTHM